MGGWIEDFLDDEDEPLFDDEIGIAFFYPNWTFDGLESTDPVHFERRAPWPTVSILRKAEIGIKVKEALDKDIILSQKIQDDNEKTLRQSGYDKLQSMMKCVMQRDS